MNEQPRAIAYVHSLVKSLFLGLEMPRSGASSASDLLIAGARVSELERCGGVRDSEAGTEWHTRTPPTSVIS